MEKKDWRRELRGLSFMKGYYFKLGDNGLVEKKDDQLVFNTEELEHFIEQELDKAWEEGKIKGRLEALPITIEEVNKAREEGREELLDSIVVGIKQLKSIVETFNPVSIEIRAKQSGEIEAYDGLLEKLSKLKDNK